MVVQVVPSEERCHRYVYALPIPVQVPGAEVSIVARTAAPATVGAAVLAGAALGIVAVGALATAATPSPLVAVTSTRTALPSSAVPTT